MSHLYFVDDSTKSSESTFVTITVGKSRSKLRCSSGMKRGFTMLAEMLRICGKRLRCTKQLYPLSQYIWKRSIPKLTVTDQTP